MPLSTDTHSLQMKSIQPTLRSSPHTVKQVLTPNEGKKGIAFKIVPQESRRTA